MKMLSLSEAAAMFAETAVTMNPIKHHCLDEGFKILQDEAKRVIGTYDYGWPRLKPQTIGRKTSGDTPLLETGDLRDSIEREVQNDAAYVGSNSEKALWHEFGTSRIPPRSFLGGAVAAKIDEIGELVGKKAHALLIKE
jgi:phage gpG-like protein